VKSEATEEETPVYILVEVTGLDFLFPLYSRNAPSYFSAREKKENEIER
jgi:hypothetical protein